MLRRLPSVAKPIVLTALLACPTACHNKPSASAGGCDGDADCSGTQTAGFCVAGVCQSCRTDSDCSADQRCAEGRCQVPSNPCLEGVNCEEDADRSADLERQGAGGGTLASTDRSLLGQCMAEDGSLEIGPVHFDFNDDALREDTLDALRQVAECLRHIPAMTVRLEGHCDERGTQEYNLALGDRRANAVRQYLATLGVDATHLRTLSKGKNEPLCNGLQDDCHAKNRRVELLRD